MEPAEDLTARARIRNAALDEFAAHGYRGATLRGIAASAGSSLGVVQHHFGNKDGLRDACDAYVLAFFQEQVSRAVDLDHLDGQAFASEAYVRAPAVLRYLGRALADGSPAVAPLFDELVSVTESYLSGRPGVDDARGDAAVFVAMRLGVYALHEHLSRALGGDALAPESLRRISASLLEIVAPEFLGAQAFRDAREALGRSVPAESAKRTKE
ncbi:TetR/AcrR family transcriptional regulator [Nonomuraea sp. KC401]|uniref:TetR/AcrR family transcriptional regulator n=1 Tax=unclassified Nonomuraea TaxID=2593643 RepID=UPI0010FEBA40|nr:MULTISPECIES: TetR/AcrR family transcriptional regulator [unclassified Nonomuraea]NBE98125.1 TetR family transcriptional regulator [Nonomuraea sp. K271]TLF60430.1 TetR/AcrR family transcriptional regulator [Nonomuraea sp. KC401]